MSDIFEGLMGQLGKGDMLGQMASSLGIDEGAAKKGLGDTVSGLFDGVKGMLGTDEGKAKVQAAIDDADDTVLDNPASVLTGDTTKAQGLLDGMFGGGNDIAQKVSGSSGLPVGQVMKMLPLALPLVMGFLKKFTAGKGMDVNGLADMLGDDSEGGILGKIKGWFGK